MDNAAREIVGLRRYWQSVIAAIALSCVLDSLLLAGFVIVGTISMFVPIAYAAVSLSIGASLSKDKDGPAYQKVAEKFKGKPDAEEKLIHHITSGEKAKFPDGHEEDHKIVKTDPANDMAQIKNFVDWILAQ